MLFATLIIASFILSILENSLHFKKYDIIIAPLGSLLFFGALTYEIFNGDNLKWGIFLTIIIPILDIIGKTNKFSDYGKHIILLEIMIIIVVAGIVISKLF